MAIRVVSLSKGMVATNNSRGIPPSWSWSQISFHGMRSYSFVALYKIKIKRKKVLPEVSLYIYQDFGFLLISGASKDSLELHRICFYARITTTLPGLAYLGS